jgi:DeoR family fructose operon transcriptional repressor
LFGWYSFAIGCESNRSAEELPINEDEDVMYATERQQRIASILSTSGRISVAEFAADMDVTTETVRRDLDALERAGLLRRVHGGAVAASRGSVAEVAVGERRAERHDAKSSIVDVAMRMIPDTFRGSVLLDAGTTTALLAERIAAWVPAHGDRLTVITNSVQNLAALDQSPHLEVHLLGGRLRGLTGALVGSSTISQVEALRPDLTFLGTNGISPRFGLSTPDEMEGAVKNAMVRSARRAVVLADGSKLGAEALVRFATLDEIDTLVTDTRPHPELLEALEDSEIEVLYS